ncbi:dehydrogenase [Aurantimonas aggregata]|uniref:Dehydrogenase n=1 Tax=Aurantimonas aggregata TaxID=2047720 RepID=A0A6L9MEQ4_9HYPH|nr:zinc-binding alcohol dehydrogenase [Aurantimonas aggregata]NDV86176.1 dehydrogenase [Aurantimonas aggregata]
MTTLCRALWLEGENDAALRDSPLPAVADGDLRIESRFGAISRGTEALVAAGRVPESEYERMRAPFQEGDFPFPVKYGYAVVGEIVEGPAERIGETVFCLYPHQDRFSVPAEAAVPIPAAVPAERAVLAANMETALNIVWDAKIGPGDRVAVVGGGLVGMLVGSLAARIPACGVTIVDRDGGRAETAAALSCSFAAPGDAPTECDVVIHASASEAGLATALDCAGFEARLVEASWYGDRSVAVPLGGAFHSRRLSIVASQVGQLPPERRARWDYRRRLTAALDLLADPRLDILISGETRFSHLAAAYAGILSNPATLCHRIRYD